MRHKVLDQIFFYSGIPLGFVVGTILGLAVSFFAVGGFEWLLHTVFQK